MDDWKAVEDQTGWAIPAWVRSGCIAPKVVEIPEGRELFAAGPDGKDRMDWGAFEEFDLDWYLRGNQLDPAWYVAKSQGPIAIYEFQTTVVAGVRAVMSKVARQGGAPERSEPAKFQFYSPLGLGIPVQGRFLGYLGLDGTFTPAESAA